MNYDSSLPKRPQHPTTELKSGMEHHGVQELQIHPRLKVIQSAEQVPISPVLGTQGKKMSFGTLQHWHSKVGEGGLPCPEAEAQDISSSNTSISSRSFTSKTLPISSLLSLLSLSFSPHFLLTSVDPSSSSFQKRKKSWKLFWGATFPPPMSWFCWGSQSYYLFSPVPAGKKIQEIWNPKAPNSLLTALPSFGGCYSCLAILLHFPFLTLLAIICLSPWSGCNMEFKTIFLILQKFTCLIISFSSMQKPLIEVISSNTFPHHFPSRTCDFP